MVNILFIWKEKATYENICIRLLRLVIYRLSLISFLVTDYAGAMPQENFITEFLRHCEEYEVEPLPSFLVNLCRYAIILIYISILLIL